MGDRALAAPVRPGPHISATRRSDRHLRGAFQALRRLASSASLTSRSSVPFSASIDDDVAVLEQRDRPADGRLGADVADAEAARGAGEAAVGDQRDLVAHALAVERRRGRQHLAHAGAALGALVADDEDVAVLVVAGPRRRRSSPPRSRTRAPGRGTAASSCRRPSRSRRPARASPCRPTTPPVGDMRLRDRVDDLLIRH